MSVLIALRTHVPFVLALRLADDRQVVADLRLEIARLVPVARDVLDELERIEALLVVLGKIRRHLEGRVHRHVERKLSAERR